MALLKLVQKFSVTILQRGEIFTDRPVEFLNDAIPLVLCALTDSYNNLYFPATGIVQRKFLP
jgi:hypothetical protein